VQHRVHHWSHTRSTQTTSAQRCALSPASRSKTHHSSHAGEQSTVMSMHLSVSLHTYRWNHIRSAQKDLSAVSQILTQSHITVTRMNTAIIVRWHRHAAYCHRRSTLCMLVSVLDKLIRGPQKQLSQARCYLGCGLVRAQETKL